MMASSDTYREYATVLTELAEQHCQGRLAFFHEGGYSALYVPFCGLAVVEAISGEKSSSGDPLLYEVYDVTGEGVHVSSHELTHASILLRRWRDGEGRSFKIISARLLTKWFRRWLSLLPKAITEGTEGTALLTMRDGTLSKRDRVTSESCHFASRPCIALCAANREHMSRQLGTMEWT